MYLPLVKMRRNQLGRLFSELGLIRSILIMALITLALVATFNISHETPASNLVASITVFGILVFHLKRPDSRFLRICFEHPIKVLWFEYAIISIPILGILLFHQSWLAGLGLTVAIVIIPFLNLSIGTIHLNSKVQRLIPDYSFEWKAGFRKYLIPFSIVWLAGICGSFFLGSVPIAMFLIGTMIIGFYEKFEALPILLSEEIGASEFMKRKVTRHLFLFALLNAPLIMAFILFHPTEFYIPLILLTLFSLLIVYVISLKYAFYTTEANSGVGQILMSIGFLGVLIPFFTPVILLMTVRYYLKAQRNLNNYLHDFD